ncbi:MAG: hypothetical protein WCA00_10505 [Candidatus Acidiferrales bacterium]
MTPVPAPQAVPANTVIIGRASSPASGRYASRFSALRAAAVLLLALLACASASFAQTDTWVNAPFGGFWSQGTNWSNGVPTSASNVQIGSLHQQIAPTVTLDINSTVTGLELDGSGTTLVLTGDSAINPSAAVNLTVTDLTTIGGGSIVNIGGGASLTLNGSSSNEGTINLATTPIIVGEAPAIGQLNGSGTLRNSGTIQGDGTVSINILNIPGGVLTGALTLNGITVTGGGYVAGQLLSINSTLDGVTLGGTPLSLPNTENIVTLLGGSVVTVQNQVTNVGTLDLANAGGGVTINGTGTIENRGFILGSGTISANIDNSGGTIQTVGTTSRLVLQGSVSGDVTRSFITLFNNSTLVLDGAQVDSNTLQGNGGTLTAQNGASFKNGVIDGTNSTVTLSAGSNLDVSGSSLKGQLQLSNSTINGAGTFQNNGTILGNGTIAVNVQNTSTGVLGGNFTVNGVTVQNGSYAMGNLTAVNATFQNVDFGGGIGTVTLTGGSNLAVSGGVVSGILVLGSGGVGATLSEVPSGGFLYNNGAIEGGGTISANIANNGRNGAEEIAATNAAVPLVLQGYIEGAATNTSESIISIGPHASLVLDGAQLVGNTLQGNGGVLSATNGALFSGGFIDGTTDQVVLAGGSTLSVSAATVQGSFQLGDASGGATLNGTSVGLELSENSILHGGGTINAQIQGVGLDSDGNGSIVADNPAAALVLAGNVSGVAFVSATSGATLTLAGSNVSTGAASVGAGSTLNGNGRIQLVAAGLGELTNAGTIAPGVAGGPGQLTIDGYYTQSSGGAMDFTLGGGTDELLVENTIAASIADFQPDSVIDAMLLSGFDPSSGCTDVFGVCESFAIFETDDLLGGVATFTGFSNISFILPTLPAGFQWLTLDENNDAIVLEIEGMKSSGGGRGGGGTTTAPEPSDWMLLASGLLGLLAFRRLARRNQAGGAACA